MTTAEELFAAIRLISKHCALQLDDCSNCPLLDWCNGIDYGGITIPEKWPDPKKGAR